MHSTNTAANTETTQEQQCQGQAPQTDLRFHTSSYYQISDNICCHNHKYAEPRGFLTSSPIRLFENTNDKDNNHNNTSNILFHNQPNIFYDSVCGKSLFVAPIGRTFEEWRKESELHGWPSFRPQEVVWENVIVHETGRLESVCGTHLGHNLPSEGRDRYCIDLVCIAGRPVREEDVNFDVEEFQSEGGSEMSMMTTTTTTTGKTNLFCYGIATLIVFSVLGSCILGGYIMSRYRQKDHLYSTSTLSEDDSDELPVYDVQFQISGEQEND